MTRPACIAPALALVFVLLLPAGSEVISGGPAVGPAEARAQAGLMQCMERCLRHEGRDQKDVCKLRCANVPPMAPGVGAGRGAGRDCMARHKDCQAACARDKACKRACRKRLLACK